MINLLLAMTTSELFAKAEEFLNTPVSIVGIGTLTGGTIILYALKYFLPKNKIIVRQEETLRLQSEEIKTLKEEKEMLIQKNTEYDARISELEKSNTLRSARSRATNKIPSAVESAINEKLDQQEIKDVARKVKVRVKKHG